MRTASIAAVLVACLALTPAPALADAGDIGIAQDLSGDIGGLGPEGPEAVPHEDTLEPGAEAEKIARAEIIRRARVWLTANAGGKVPYSQKRKWRDGYRQDCSGYVSMAWKLPKGKYGGTNTVGLAQSYTTKITKADLKAGDVLLDWHGTKRTRHVVLFDKWTSASRTHYWGYDQSGSQGGTAYRKIPYPYFTSKGQWEPRRSKNIG
ncbi:NlpC/P60 family protein [Allokutzneria sp. NRRL B-24872]|uniref:NlpC/P60 family protein n=1 Tax=Allokutzneria sp. NRRL B-24872 TaxID=1137961 RepID=UPI00117835F0|nr:NlpC/P60 family protein [Allokutzneria sp. NRRL B-24872]